MARILKKDAKRLLDSVSEDSSFWCSDGRVLRSMRELEGGLAGMTDETFAYHSNAEKADFSSWVKDIIGDEKLARDLSRSPNRTQAAKFVTSRIAFLDTKLAS